MMQIHILDAQNYLRPFEAKIRDSAARAIACISNQLNPDLDICFSNDPKHCNPELGIGGGAFSPNLLHVFLDIQNGSIASSIEDELLAVLAHEIHHCVRMGVVDDSSLADRLITEGLACQFETEITGVDTPSFLPGETIESWNDYFAKMSPIMDSEEFCEDTFFLGKNPQDLPKYAGYAVGFGLVREYLATKNVTAAESVLLPTADFFGEY